MIVKPTVKELLNHAENRFALVIATSRRARQIADGEDPLVKNVDSESPVTIAANEINEGEVRIIEENTENETADDEEQEEIESE